MFFMMVQMKGQLIKKKIIAKLPSFLKRNKKIVRDQIKKIKFITTMYYSLSELKCYKLLL